MSEHQAPQKQATLIVFASVTGRDNWIPVHELDVPAWLKDDPVKMGRLVAGEICQDCAEGDKGSPWYRAEVVH